MFRKITIVLALALGGIATSAALADGPGSSGGYEAGSTGIPTASVSDNLHSSQANGHRDTVVYDDGPGLGGGY